MIILLRREMVRTSSTTGETGNTYEILVGKLCGIRCLGE
jgi:hypothetical protein